VVSALEGTTDALLARAAAWSAGVPADSGAPAVWGAAAAAATLLSTGELQSAAILGLALDRAGIPAQVLDHAAIGLRTTGPAFDATPASLDTAALLAALDRAPVAVVPGFTGRDEFGQITTLGRGGSDLSALFIAQQLKAAGHLATCRLVKDVDGLYTRDPALPGPPARRYAALSWDDALALDGTIVQHKGVRFARKHQLPFEVAGLLAPRASVVGEHAATFDDHPRTPPRPLRIALLGPGTVGGGVLDVIASLPWWFQACSILCRSAGASSVRGLDPDLVTTDPDAVFAACPDMIVETIGGLEPARALIGRAIDSGIPVVTANKAVIADSSRDLASWSAALGVPLCFSAAVGGAVPMLETARRLAGAGDGAPENDRVTRIEGVLNGTTNFVLARVVAGERFDDAVRAAQAAGFAEADPSRDLDGRDAADKLALLIRAAFGVPFSPEDVERAALDAAACAQHPPAPGRVLKHLARAELTDTGSVRASVRPTWLPADSLAALARNEENAVTYTTVSGRTITMSGKGAGRHPTTLAVVADLIDLAHASLGRVPCPSDGSDLPVAPFESASPVPPAALSGWC
jgi:homoserine dehydrogenase